MSKSFFEKLVESLIYRVTQETFKSVFRKRKPPSKQPSTENSEPSAVGLPKIHPWRLCGEGRHWVVTHPLKTRVSMKNPSGETVRDGHCANNPTRSKGKKVQDYLSRYEIDAIAENEFSKLINLSSLGALPQFEGSEKYDSYIQGWARYWNEVLNPKTPLDPNVIKALIASESSFDLEPKIQAAGVAGKARGFIQLTDQAITALSDLSGEIKDHYVKITAEETSDANMSICAGIRWIFQKQKLASNDLKREASWVEAVEKYKGALNKSEEKKQKELGQFYEIYQKIKK